MAIVCRPARCWDDGCLVDGFPVAETTLFTNWTGVIRSGVVEVQLRAGTMASLEVIEIRLRAGEPVTGRTDVASSVAVVSAPGGTEAVS